LAGILPVSRTGFGGFAPVNGADALVHGPEELTTAFTLQYTFGLLRIAVISEVGVKEFEVLVAV
jgi:hypothetical protein